MLCVSVALARRLLTGSAALVLVASVVGVGAPQAQAEDAPHTYRGYLSMIDGVPRYVAVDTATGQTAYVSAGLAIDGALDPNSADGLTVAYVGTEDSGDDFRDWLTVRTPDGTEQVVYRAPLNVDISEPTVAADSSKVVFVVDSDTASGLGMVDLRSGAIKQLATPPDAVVSGPSLSPDGRYLSWTRDTDSDSSIIISKVDGTEPGIMNIVRYNGYDPTSGFDDTAWSFDGDEIMAGQWFASQPPESESLLLFHQSSGQQGFPAQGGTSNGVTTSYVEPAWAPDGSGVYATKVTETDTDETITPVFVTRDGTISDAPADGYLGSPSASGPPPPADTTAPNPPAQVSQKPTQARVNLHWYGSGRDDNVAETVITRNVGAAADTPTAENTVALTRLPELDIPLPEPDTEYGISLFYRDWAGNLSAPLKVQVTSTHRTTVTLDAPSRITYGASARLTGRVAQDPGYYKISLYARRAGTHAPGLQSTIYTNSDGTFTFQTSPAASTEYTVRYDGNDANYPATSPARTVTVTPVVTFALSTSSTIRGRGVTLTGTVKPTLAGQRVSIQRYVGGAWRVIGYATLSSTSSYRYVLKPMTAGTWKLRVGKGADTDHPVAYSPAHYLYVR